MLILGIGINSAPNQEFDSIYSIIFTSEMKRRSQRSIDQVWLGSSPLNKLNEHLGVSERSSLMND